jgi:hypothetical protein
MALSELDKSFLRWGLNQGTDDLVWFYNSVKGLLKREYNDALAQNDPIKIRNIERVNEMGIIATFLLVFAQFEETLYGVWRTLGADIDISREEGVLERYKPVFAKLNVKVGSMPCWSRLRDASRIRNCLMHGGGVIKLMRDKDALGKVVQGNSRGLQLCNGRLIMKAAYLDRFVKDVRSFRDTLIGA